MDFIKENNHDQMIFSAFEMSIERHNPVWFVDVFVEHLNFSQLGFVVGAMKTEGRPAFE